MELERESYPKPASEEAPLFLRCSGRIVLIGLREADSWVLARGWRSTDRLSHVRRWRFATSDLFLAQVRRLTQEECGHSEAEDAARDADRWIAAVSARQAG